MSFSGRPPLTPSTGSVADVARLTLQTLINTYPDSGYAREAEDTLRTDSRLQSCNEVKDIGSTTWHVGPPDVTN